MKDTKYTPNLRRAKGLETVRGFIVDESSERVWKDVNEEKGELIGEMTVVSLNSYMHENESFTNRRYTPYFSP